MIGPGERKFYNFDIKDRRKWPSNSLRLGHFSFQGEVLCIYMHFHLFIRKAQLEILFIGDYMPV